MTDVKVVWVIACAFVAGCAEVARVEESAADPPPDEVPSAVPDDPPAFPPAFRGVDPVASAREVRDPRLPPVEAPTRQGRWKPASDVWLGCDRHTADPIGAGRVLITGFCSLGTDVEVHAAVVYDADSRTYTPIAVNEPRSFHSSVVTTDGRVAIVGDGAHVELFSAELGAFELGPALLEQRTEPTLVALSDGRIWVIGGLDATGFSMASTEIVDPMGGASVAGPALGASRARAAAIATAAGVVVLGGETTVSFYSGNEPLATTEIAACEGCAFEPGPELTTGGAIAAAATGGGAFVATMDWSMWWAPGTDPVEIPHDEGGSLFMPDLASLEGGDTFAVGSAVYANLVFILRFTAGEPAVVVGSRSGMGMGLTITPLDAKQLFVIGSNAWIFIPPADAG